MCYQRVVPSRCGQVPPPRTRSLDLAGVGRTRWTTRWKPALNAFADRFPGAETYSPTVRNTFARDFRSWTRVGCGHPASTTPIVAEGDVIGHRRVDDLPPSEPRGDHLDVKAPVRAGQPDPGPGSPVALEPPDHLPTEKWSLTLLEQPGLRVVVVAPCLDAPERIWDRFGSPRGGTAGDTRAGFRQSQPTRGASERQPSRRRRADLPTGGTTGFGHGPRREERQRQPPAGRQLLQFQRPRPTGSPNETAQLPAIGSDQLARQTSTRAEANPICADVESVGVSPGLDPR